MKMKFRFPCRHPLFLRLSMQPLREKKASAINSFFITGLRVFKKDSETRPEFHRFPLLYHALVADAREPGGPPAADCPGAGLFIYKKNGYNFGYKWNLKT
jgi:hypothetical protein